MTYCSIPNHHAEWSVANGHGLAQAKAAAIIGHGEIDQDKGKRGTCVRVKLFRATCNLPLELTVTPQDNSQLRTVHRFYQKVIHADIQTGIPILLAVIGRQRNDRQMPAAPQLLFAPKAGHG